MVFVVVQQNRNYWHGWRILHHSIIPDVEQVFIVFQTRVPHLVGSDGFRRDIRPMRGVPTRPDSNRRIHRLALQPFDEFGDGHFRPANALCHVGDMGDFA